MGQAWCKEKTSKAQDSKSPLDRVFVRCAHRIYPSLKEEGSVLGGATQRVTSSEIGYAGSPPREVLTRGRSIDSVDRPFHPSDWVDVNLEVPSTPRASSVLTNLTVDTNLYPGTTPTSSCSNLKDATPVPPPRRRKRNKGRPLPPKPDEIPENPTGSNSARVDAVEEPLYSSVKSPKTSGDEQDRDEESRLEKSCTQEREEPRQEGKRSREIYEHKVNGTGRIIPREVVSGKRAYHPEERRTERSCDTGNSDRRIHEDEEYERFARNQSVKDSSTPYREQNGRRPELENRIKDPSQESVTTGSGARTKNYSTVSLPNYDELDVARHSAARTKGEGGVEERAKSRRPVRSSTGSLPAESFLSPFSEKTSVRFEDYIPRRGSTENLPPYQVLGKLDSAENGVSEAGFVKYDPSKLEDWNLTDIGNCESNHHRRLSFEGLSGIGDQKRCSEGEDVVDFSTSIGARENEGKDRQEISGSPIVLQKPSGFGMTAASEEEEDSGLGRKKEERKTCEPIDSSNGPHARFYDPPTLENCKLSGACSPSAACTEPFFLNEEKHRAVLDTIGESCRNGAISLESDRGPRSRMIFARSLSNESEPYEDACESKELSDRPSPCATGKLIRTISEESLPREMLEEVDRELDDFFDEKLAKDVHNKLKKDCAEQRLVAKTPPPSPEPRITAEILDNDHSALLKILKEEAAEESNLSSMTPSLTELEAALSDMLEKEDPQEDAKLQQRTEEQRFPRSPDRLIEPDIVPVEKNPGFREDPVTPGSTGKTLVDGTSVPDAGTLEQFNSEERKPPAKTRKVSFCAWEDVRTPELDAAADDSKKDSTSSCERTMDFPPEKPSRLQRSMEDSMEHPDHVPTPPRRRNKGPSFGRKDTSGESYPNDRLI